MIRQILDFSRQSVFERQVLDLLPLLKEEEKLLKQTLPENVEITLEAARGEYFVKADPTRMQQLATNLAVNARDAMPHGGQLRIALERLIVTDTKRAPVPGMDAGEWVRIDVQDTGVGIPPEHLPHIFEPFFTTKAPGKGTGLGLAQVYGIVAQHDGHITVASEAGMGTTLSIYLPAHAQVQAGAGGAARALLPRGRGERILLVEDDATVRASLVALLQAWNYQVVEAADGAEALVYLTGQERQVDLALSDVVMPRLGGIGLVKALRKRGLHMPTILMSGHAPGEDRATLQEAEVQDWIDKPLSSWLLAQAIARVLGRMTEASTAAMLSFRRRGRLYHRAGGCLLFTGVVIPEECQPQHIAGVLVGMLIGLADQPQQRDRPPAGHLQLMPGVAGKAGQ